MAKRISSAVPGDLSRGRVRGESASPLIASPRELWGPIARRAALALVTLFVSLGIVGPGTTSSAGSGVEGIGLRALLDLVDLSADSEREVQGGAAAPDVEFEAIEGDLDDETASHSSAFVATASDVVPRARRTARVARLGDLDASKPGSHRTSLPRGPPRFS